MRKSLIVFILVLIAVGAAFGWLYSQPDKWQIADKAVVNASTQSLYPLLIEPSRWAAWSTWNDNDQDNLKRDYQGPDIGVGATEVWHFNGKDGITVITNSADNQYLEYQVSGMQGAFLAMAKIELRPISEHQTEITWTANGDGGGIIILKAIAEYGRWQMQTIHRSSLNKLQRLAKTIEMQNAQ